MLGMMLRGGQCSLEKGTASNSNQEVASSVKIDVRGIERYVLRYCRGVLLR